MHVLLVEDDPTLLGLLGQIFEEDGHRVTLARTADQALTFATFNRYDVAVTDVFGPTFAAPDDAFSAVVRTLAARTPVVIMSGRAWARDPAVAASLGASAILPKPFDLDDVLSVARSVTAPQLVAAGVR